MFCLACGYSLLALIKPQCPECGRPFNPYDAQTFKESRPVTDQDAPPPAP